MQPDVASVSDANLLMRRSIEIGPCVPVTNSSTTARSAQATLRVWDVHGVSLLHYTKLSTTSKSHSSPRRPFLGDPRGRPLGTHGHITFSLLAHSGSPFIVNVSVGRCCRSTDARSREGECREAHCGRRPSPPRGYLNWQPSGRRPEGASGPLWVAHDRQGRPLSLRSSSLSVSLSRLRLPPSVGIHPYRYPPP